MSQDESGHGHSAQCVPARQPRKQDETKRAKFLYLPNIWRGTWQTVVSRRVGKRRGGEREGCVRKKNKEDEGFSRSRWWWWWRRTWTAATYVAYECRVCCVVLCCMHGVAVRINQLSKMREGEREGEKEKEKEISSSSSPSYHHH